LIWESISFYGPVSRAGNANFGYELPFGSGQRLGRDANGVVGELIGVGKGTGTVTAQRGFPFTPQIGFNNSGTGNQKVADVLNRNPDFKGPVILRSRSPASIRKPS
jgi:hypothetical protein